MTGRVGRESGRVPAGGQAGDPWGSWVNPTSVLGGVLAVVVVAFLAAVYLVWDARRLAADGYHLVGGVGQYEGIWRMASVRGPEGFIVNLAQPIN